jgi:hypothetical protein
MLVKIDAILNGIETKSTELERRTPKIRETASTFRDAERLALRWLTVARKMGLPDEVNQATQIITELVIMLRMLQLSFSLMSGGGIGAAIGVAGLVSVVMTANDMLGYDAMRGY